MTAAARLATFWQGPLNPFVYACLASFPAAGAQLSLYAYDLTIETPRGVMVEDARAICPDASLTRRYRVEGQPSLAVFSDRFRYDLLSQTDACWVDADILCLRAPDFPPGSVVWGLQAEAKGKALINNAVLGFPHGHPVLEEMRRRAHAAADVDLSWGAIGPFLLTELAEAEGVYASARDERAFYPVAPDDFWRLLIPGCRDAIEASTKDSLFLHLWSELFRRAGYDFEVAPPPGCYLHAAFARVGALDRFKRVYTSGEIETMLAPWMGAARTAGAAI